MKMFFIIFLLFAQIVGAETKYFLAMNLNNKETLIQLDEALKLGSELRIAINQLEKTEADSPTLPNLREKLKQFESQLQKSFGLYPGLNYKMVPTSGVIYQLTPITDDKIEFKSENIIFTKNSAGESIRCLKEKIKELNDSESVTIFNRTLLTVQALKTQIADFEKQLNEKPELKENEEIKSAMVKLKESLSLMETKLLENFSIKADGKYTFEPQTGAIYLVLTENELQKLSEFNQKK